MPRTQDKKHRSLEFARQLGEAKPVLEPPDDSYILHSQQTRVKQKQERIEGLTLSYTVQLWIEHYRPWPDCPWPEPCRAILAECYQQADLDKLYDGHCFLGPDFYFWSGFHGTSEEAVADVKLVRDSTPTF